MADAHRPIFGKFLAAGKRLTGHTEQKGRFGDRPFRPVSLACPVSPLLVLFLPPETIRLHLMAESSRSRPQYSNPRLSVQQPSSYGSATFRRKHFSILASALALPPDLRQKAEGFSNGLKRGSATMHSRKRMVGLRNFNGWTRQLPWFSFRASMVQLLHFHPLA